jgi:WD40 repeat protein
MKQCANELKSRDDSESPIRALALGSTPEPVTIKKKKKKKRSDDDAPAYSDTAPQALANLVFAAHGIGEIKCWDIRVNKVVQETYVGHKDVVNCLQVHNGHLFSGSDDRTVRMFDIQR